MSKGSRQRPTQDRRKFNDNWDRIFNAEKRNANLQEHMDVTVDVLEQTRAENAKLQAKLYDAYELGFDDGTEYGENPSPLSQGSKTREQVLAALDGGGE